MNIRKPFIVFIIVIVFLIGCAGRPVKNTPSLSGNGSETIQEDTARQWDVNCQSNQTFYERNRQIITDAFIATLVVAEIALFWYLVDEYHDSDEAFLWIGPIWPWGY